MMCDIPVYQILDEGFVKNAYKYALERKTSAIIVEYKDLM